MGSFVGYVMFERIESFFGKRRLSLPISPKSHSRIARNQLLGRMALIAIVVIAGVAFSSVMRRPKFLDIAQRLDDSRHLEIEEFARSWLEQHPNDIDALLLLGKVFQRKGHGFAALEQLRRIPRTAGERAIVAQLAICEILVQQRQFSEAELVLKWLDRNASTRRPAIDDLWVTLLTLSGQRWESIPSLRRVTEVDGNPFKKWMYLASSDEMLSIPHELALQLVDANDPLATLGYARHLAANGETDQTLVMVRQCLAKRPDVIEAQSLLGQLLLDSGDLEQFSDWEHNLPPSANDHPAIWFLRGRRAQDDGMNAEAKRCYWEALRRHPNHDRSTYHLGQLLAADGRWDEANLFLERAERLARLKVLWGVVYRNGGAKEVLEEAAQLIFDLGRLRECRGWCEHLLQRFPSNTVATELMAKLDTELRENTPWILPESNLAMRINPSSIGLPSPLTPRDQRTLPSLTSKQESTGIAFVDDAQRMGLHFVQFNGEDSANVKIRLLESTTGGGVAAFDYDLDGWCDLYFTQGTNWPRDSTQREHLDVLFRNVAGQRMLDVTQPVGIRDDRFGQGVSAGDFDNDGFSDLYVANIDGNRLYANHGDGTFEDITESTGLGCHGHWTTSCMIADLDGDGVPDVYDVTFVEGHEHLTRICQDETRGGRLCAPAGFPASLDHVYKNHGDGTFGEMTQEWGFDVPYGDGLGIVAADFDDSGTMSVYVGNDGRANFFFVRKTMPDGKFFWNQMGVVSGLAFDDSGAAEATMGIAAGDANNDGRLDLFTTNFFFEADSLYLNLAPRIFEDRARSMGLHEPSRLMLGFGTQFLDADLDGWEDLIVTNGHFDDLSSKQIPYKMRPQMFHNQQTRFAERLGKEIGPFFDQLRLGRGLARLDWNRDGLNDVAISHSADPAALLTNQTLNPGSGMGLRLVGTKGSRDAIGTKVVVTAGPVQLTRQLVGGDGYQAKNEQRLEFGLGGFTGEVEIRIHWMCGAVEKFDHAKTNCEYIAIEGRGELVPIHNEP